MTMAGETAAGFWSYSHQDNKLDGGAILELASLIMRSITSYQENL
jgi:hypothetical protein